MRIPWVFFLLEIAFLEAQKLHCPEAEIHGLYVVVSIIFLLFSHNLALCLRGMSDRLAEVVEVGLD